MGYIKICGVRRLKDAALAYAYGATAVGLVFAARSPRRVTVSEARRIRRELGPWPALVGVFVDEPLRTVKAVVEEVGLSAVQLHGSERPGYERVLGELTTIKAVRVGAGFDPRCMSGHRPGAWLFDTDVTGAAGGTGRAFDWSLLKRVRTDRPIILAGGLDAANVARAIRQVRPYGVEASSRIESSPGSKDPVAMKRFIVNAQKAFKTLP